MNAMIRYACSLAEDLLDLPFTLLDTSEVIENLCQKYCFHPVQRFLTTSSLDTLLQTMNDSDLICLTDPLHITFHFFLLESVPICVGPYCSDTLTSPEVALLFRQLQIESENIPAFLAYRSQFQQLPEHKVLNYIDSLTHHIDPHAPSHQLRRIGYEERAFVIERPEPNQGMSYSQIINARYSMEDYLCASIKKGNYTSALKTMHSLMQDVEYLLAIGSRSENVKTAMIILGTQIRLYAVDSGLSPVLIDQITSDYMEKQRAEKTPEGQQRVIEDMLKTLCREVRKKNSQKLNSTALSIQYYIEKNYQQDISLSELADDLNLSYNYMISHFKKQTGITPGAYIIETRLHHAKRLLTHSKKNIAQISSEVGIPDANYFTKLFKQKYGKTPSQYRKQL